MIIINPVSLGDVSCTRATSAPYYDRNGALQMAPPNTLRVTYDPADLSRAPYALLDAGEVIGPGSGLVYSNVAITETPYNSGSTYATGAQVYDPATYLMYQSLIANNTGKALTDTTSWTPLNVPVNRWKMFDQYNQTQTSNPEEIIIVISTRTLARGAFLGNIDGLDARYSVTDLTTGLVYQETQNLTQSNSKSSLYRWGFERIRRKRVTSTTKLPPYANALVTIAIRKPGGTAKCGVAVVGSTIDLGLAQYGLGRGIKDWSTVQFNFDGTEDSTPRGFSKTMELDVVIDNSNMDYAIDTMEDLRQKPVAWVATDLYSSAGIFGKYQSFKNVIENYPQSKMSLQIQGTV